MKKYTFVLGDFDLNEQEFTVTLEEMNDEELYEYTERVLRNNPQAAYCNLYSTEDV